MEITLSQFISEMMTLIAQIAAAVLSVGMAIYAFQFPILREGAQHMPMLATSQHSRLRKKILALFLMGNITIISAIIFKLIVFIYQNYSVLIYHVAAGIFVSLIITMYCLYSLFPEIGLKDE